MLQILTSGVGLAAIGMYVYVGVAVGRMEAKTGADWLTLAGKAAVWPVTIWHTIEKLYDFDV